MNIIIVTNEVTLASDLQTIENYIKTANCINLTRVEVPCLSQSKSYLKIIDVPYYQENLSSPITLNVVENIIKQNHIFNNVVLASKLHVIKVFPKLDMAIVVKIIDSGLYFILFYFFFSFLFYFTFLFLLIFYF